MTFSNLWSNTTAAQAVSATVSADGKTVTFNLPTSLDYGYYRIALPAGSVAGTSGSVTLEDTIVSGGNVFALLADANRDRQVNTLDFNILAQNFWSSGKQYTQGNFNYDSNGAVDSSDFNFFIANYGRKVFLPGDADGNWKVNTLDFNILAANFGKSSQTFSQGDFNIDGNVDSVDFTIFAASYGVTAAVQGSSSFSAPSNQPIELVSTEEASKVLQMTAPSIAGWNLVGVGADDPRMIRMGTQRICVNGRLEHASKNVDLHDTDVHTSESGSVLGGPRMRIMLHSSWGGLRAEAAQPSLRDLQETQPSFSP